MSIWNSGSEPERRRLLVQADLLDPITVRHLERLGVSPGWRCAEIGAGAGSIASWLCRRVGSGGRVVATDIDTRYLSELQEPSLEVRLHDITAQPLENEAYDLIHARLVLFMLRDRLAALRRMVAALRPGGWLLVEEYDQRTAAGFDPSSELQAKVSAAVNMLFETQGADPYYGLKLVPSLRAVGLAHVQAEARLQIVELGTAPAEALAMKIEQLGEKLVNAHLLTQEEVGQAILHARTPGAGVHYPPLMVSAWGQRVP
jgi:SAM-dependent methyltransferase